MSPPIEPITARESVNIKHTALLAILLALIIIRPFIPSTVADCIFLPTIIFSAWLAGGRTARGLVLTVLFCILAGLILAGEMFFREQFRIILHESTRFLVAFAVLSLLIYCGAMILRSLLRVDRVFLNEIIGTLNLYLILGHSWAFLYLMLESSSPGSFNFGDEAASLHLQFLYFSFVTLTTVGYGDVIPLSPAAKMCSVLEAILGQFYVAVVVAYLVSMYITHNMVSNRKDE